MFYLFRKGDYYRYLAEFSSGTERKEAADQSLEAYKVLGSFFCLFPLFCVPSLLYVNLEKLNDMLIFVLAM